VARGLPALGIVQIHSLGTDVLRPEGRTGQAPRRLRSTDAAVPKASLATS